jgi:tRNA1Val (adenine37-N6)-methyltransferase
MPQLTSDSFFNGRIQIRQNRTGYRFSIDAVLLAYHVRPRPGDRVLDLGTGCGIVPLILAFRHPDITIYGIEIQQELCELGISNVSSNHMQDRITMLCQDMKELKPYSIDGPVDLVVCNPPYRKSNSGRLNPDQQRAVARHEIKTTLPDVILAARRMLRTAGKLVMIYAAERTAELITQMNTNGIEPKLLRSIHSSQGTAAKLVLVEGTQGGRSGTNIAPPLILYDDDGEYTPEVLRMFEP